MWPLKKGYHQQSGKAKYYELKILSKPVKNVSTMFATHCMCNIYIF